MRALHAMLIRPCVERIERCSRSAFAARTCCILRRRHDADSHIAVLTVIIVRGHERAVWSRRSGEERR